jgi:hypothetical protein
MDYPDKSLMHKLQDMDYYHTRTDTYARDTAQLGYDLTLAVTDDIRQAFRQKKKPDQKRQDINDDWVKIATGRNNPVSLALDPKRVTAAGSAANQSQP